MVNGLAPTPQTTLQHFTLHSHGYASGAICGSVSCPTTLYHADCRGGGPSHQSYNHWTTTLAPESQCCLIKQFKCTFDQNFWIKHTKYLGPIGGISPSTCWVTVVMHLLCLLPFWIFDTKWWRDAKIIIEGKCRKRFRGPPTSGLGYGTAT